MKSDWNDAPEWANYAAMDDDGVWNWYENEPILRSYCWSEGRGRFREIRLFNGWQSSLTKRPEK